MAERTILLVVHTGRDEVTETARRVEGARRQRHWLAGVVR